MKTVNDLLSGGIDVREGWDGDWHWGLEFSWGNLFDHSSWLEDTFYVEWRGWREAVPARDVGSRGVVEVAEELRVACRARVLEWVKLERRKLETCLDELDALEISVR